jgi:hypothetical protein
VPVLPAGRVGFGESEVELLGHQLQVGRFRWREEQGRGEQQVVRPEAVIGDVACNWSAMCCASLIRRCSRSLG